MQSVGLVLGKGSRNQRIDRQKVDFEKLTMGEGGVDEKGGKGKERGQMWVKDRGREGQATVQKRDRAISGSRPR